MPHQPLLDDTAGSPAATRTTAAVRARRIVIHRQGDSPFPSLERAIELSRPGSPSRKRFALVVPTRPALEHAKNEVARLAGAVDPREFFTILGLAKRVLGAACPPLATLAVRDAVLELALECVASGELRAARVFRGLRRRLLGLFSELETLGVEPRAFGGLLAGARGRAEIAHPDVVHARLAEAYAAYRGVLARRKLAVEPDLLRLATRAVERDKAACALPEILLVDGFIDLAPAQLELLSALAGRAEESTVHWLDAIDSAGPGPRKRMDETTGETTLARGLRALRSRGFVVEAAREEQPGEPRTPLRASAVEHVLANVFLASPSPQPTSPVGLTLTRAGSPADEAACVLRIARAAVLGEGRSRSARATSWNDVLVAVPNARAVRARFERAARELSVPIRVHAPKPLLSSQAARGALAFLRAAVTLETAPLLYAATVPALGLDLEAADRLTREVRRRGLGSAASSVERPWARELPAPARALLDDVLALSRALAATPLPDGARAVGLVRRALLARLGRPVLRDLGARPSEADLEAAADEVAACESLDALLRGLEQALGGPPPAVVSPQDLLRRIEEDMGEAEYLPRDQRRKVVHVVSVDEARSWAAPVVVVAGLAEGSLPRSRRDELLLDDATRRALAARGTRLATLEDFAERERLLFLLAASCARDELHLVHSGFDDSGEPVRPSIFFEAVSGLFRKGTRDEGANAVGECGGDTELTVPFLRRSPSDVVPASLADIATPLEARRFAYLRGSASFTETVSDAASRARAGAALLELLLRDPAEADRAREALAPRRWELSAALGAGALERVYSASELETYATCPYRHFVRHLLGVRRRDDLGVTGLDARLQGRIVHDALERAIARGDSPEAAFDAAFADAVRDLPLGPDEESFRRAARAAVLGFLLEDDPGFLARAGFDRAHAEVAFGPGTPAGPLLVRDVGLGGEIRLEGRIDRIDEGPRGAFVTDYKLGAEEVDRAARNALARGEKLQLSVYLLALERVLGKRPLGAALVALATRRRTGITAEGETALAAQESPRVSLAPVDLPGILAACEEAIRKIVHGIAASAIDASPRDPTECRRCDARFVCRFRERPLALTPAKAAGPAKAVVKETAWRPR